MSMNVVLEGLQVQKHTESIKTTNTNSYTTAAGAKTAPDRGFSLDISGTVRDNVAYADKAKSTEELISDAKATQAAIQSQYMTVMSNSVSGTDVKQLMEEGYRPCEMELEDAVNTVDRIKATLAEAGVVIAGYNDDLDMETLEQITGSKSMALDIQKNFVENDIPVTEENVRDVVNATEVAKQIKEPGEGTTKYLVENQMSPTVENLYLASYSGSVGSAKQSYGYYDQNGLGYYAKKAEEYDWGSLQEQMESIIEKAGLEVNDTNMQNARFLVESGIPLTTDTIGRMAQITKLHFPLEESQLLRAAAIAIADGEAAMKADLNVSENLIKQAVRVKQEVDRISEQALEDTVDAGKPLTIRNLVEAQAMISTEADKKTEKAHVNVQDNVALNQAKTLTAKRQLEEVRLMMTVHVNLGLLKKGYQIDTTELSQLVEDLKQEENIQNQLRFRTEDTALAMTRAKSYEDTENLIREVPTYPLSMVGGIHIRITTLSEVSVLAHQHIQQYEAAGEQYETFMTAPRKDLGDSIKKAFRNVDDILEDLQFELNDTNRRAVRILGYNQMELTVENIARVKDADLLLQRVVDKLTPAATLQMIREGENPLDMTLEELEAYLTGMDLQEEVMQEKYSKYLYKLERSGKITEEEKESFIGIYRLFRQVEKSDGAVIGSLINSRAKLSVSNLLSAIRTRSKNGMNVQISDETGAASMVHRNGVAIDDQIASAYRTYEHRLTSDVYDKLDPVLLKNGMGEQEMTDVSLEQLREQLMQAGQEEVEESNRLEREYYREQLQQIRDLADIDDDTIQEILDGRQPVSAGNLHAAQALLHSKSTVFDRLEKRMRKIYDKLPEAFGDKDTAQTAYEEMIEEADRLLQEDAQADVNADDAYRKIRDIHQMVRELHLAGNLAKEEHYMVPVQTQEGLTAIHLTLRHEADAQGHVSVSMNTSMGQIDAELAIADGKVYGNIECNEAVARTWMQGVKEKVQEYVDMNVDATQDKTDTSALYGLAKAFIMAIQSREREG